MGLSKFVDSVLGKRSPPPATSNTAARPSKINLRFQLDPEDHFCQNPIKTLSIALESRPLPAEVYHDNLLYSEIHLGKRQGWSNAGKTSYNVHAAVVVDYSARPVYSDLDVGGTCDLRIHLQDQPVRSRYSSKALGTTSLALLELQPLHQFTGPLCFVKAQASRSPIADDTDPHDCEIIVFAVTCDALHRRPHSNWDWDDNPVSLQPSSYDDTAMFVDAMRESKLKWTQCSHYSSHELEFFDKITTVRGT